MKNNQASLLSVGDCEIYRGEASVVYTDYLRYVSANDNVYLALRPPFGLIEQIKRLFMPR
mgnify:CR=1 FL=1